METRKVRAIVSAAEFGKSLYEVQFVYGNGEKFYTVDRAKDEPNNKALHRLIKTYSKAFGTEQLDTLSGLTAEETIKLITNNAASAAKMVGASLEVCNITSIKL